MLSPVSPARARLVSALRLQLRLCAQPKHYLNRFFTSFCSCRAPRSRVYNSTAATATAAAEQLTSSLRAAMRCCINHRSSFKHIPLSASTTAAGILRRESPGLQSVGHLQRCSLSQRLSSSAWLGLPTSCQRSKALIICTE